MTKGPDSRHQLLDPSISLAGQFRNKMSVVDTCCPRVFLAKNPRPGEQLLIHSDILSSFIPLLKTFPLLCFLYKIKTDNSQRHISLSFAFLLSSRKIKINWKKIQESENVSKKAVICLQCELCCV